MGRLKDSEGYPTTAKLARIAAAYEGGDSTAWSEAIPYAKQGYRRGEELLIAQAAQGDPEARKELARLLVGENHLTPEQMQRALPLSSLDEHEQRVVLAKTANQGEQWALEQLKGLNPAIPELSFLADCAKRDLIARMTEENALHSRWAIEENIKQLQASIEGPNPTSLERLLAERIVICYLQLNHIDRACAKSTSTGLAVLESQQKRLDRAQSRYLKAIKTLAEVRKLAFPNLQVNIAEKQVNLA